MKPQYLNGLVAFTLLMGFSMPALASPGDADSKADARSSGGSRWGASYFPNVPLTDQDGKTSRFFDDLIKDKVVVINFIYTTCPDVCPLETAQLAELQAVLGDRVGRDVFMYSITIDPETDTPKVLKAFADKFNAKPGWSFLTGKESDIITIRKKLGIFIDEIQGVRDDGTRDHNISMIIGNQATGQWMKRSPFENPYILAAQVGSWLSNWQQPVENQTDYKDAPELRKLTRGETLYRTRCAACHTIGGNIFATGQKMVGPDLLGVVDRRDPVWLAKWLAAPDEMIAKQDPLALELFNQFNKLMMPNMDLNEIDIKSIVEYMQVESRRVQRAQQNRLAGVPALNKTEVPKSCCQKMANPTLSSRKDIDDTTTAN